MRSFSSWHLIESYQAIIEELAKEKDKLSSDIYNAELVDPVVELDRLLNNDARLRMIEKRQLETFSCFYNDTVEFYEKSFKEEIDEMFNYSSASQRIASCREPKAHMSDRILTYKLDGSSRPNKPTRASFLKMLFGWMK